MSIFRSIFWLILIYLAIGVLINFIVYLQASFLTMGSSAVMNPLPYSMTVPDIVKNIIYWPFYLTLYLDFLKHV